MALSRLYYTAYLIYNILSQARYPFKPLTIIKRDQARRVRHIVGYAYRYVPYYHETMKRLGLTPADFTSADDLARLPLLERSQIQHNPEYFISTKQPIDKYFQFKTGGSTGIPLPVYYDKKALYMSAILGERERSIIYDTIGKRFGYRETFIASKHATATYVRAACQEHAWFPPQVKIERQCLSVFDPPEKNIPLINEFKPDLIHCYGSYLEMIIAYLKYHHVPFHKPKIITYSSDGMSPEGRDIYLNQLHIPIISVYQSIEAFKIGFECEQHRGLHLNIDVFPVRIVKEDGSPVPPGETGELVISNLHNHGMVLLNYRLGDIASLLLEKCSCGRQLPLLSFPPGRLDDFVVLPSGSIIHPQALRTMFTRIDGLWQYQVIQETPALFTIKAVVSDVSDRNHIISEIKQKFYSRFGDEVKISIQFVNGINLTESGKHRIIVSRVKHDQLFGNTLRESHNSSLDTN